MRCDPRGVTRHVRVCALLNSPQWLRDRPLAMYDAYRAMCASGDGEHRASICIDVYHVARHTSVAARIRLLHVLGE
jgi:hypothetical protein